MARSDQQLRKTSDRLLGPSAFWLWCVPGCVAIGTSILEGEHTVSLPAAGVLWTAATLWIGLGCAWNARACGRVHNAVRCSIAWDALPAIMPTIPTV